MKKLTIVGMMVVACFTQAMENNDEKKKSQKHKKTYSAVAQSAAQKVIPKSIPAQTPPEMLQIMQLDQVSQHPKWYPVPKNSIVFDARTLGDATITVDPDGRCKLRNGDGDTTWQSQHVQSAKKLLESLQEVHTRLNPSQPRTLKRSQSSEAFFTAAPSALQKERKIKKVDENEEDGVVINPQVAPISLIASSSSSSSAVSQAVSQASATPQPEQQQGVSASQQQAVTASSGWFTRLFSSTK